MKTFKKALSLILAVLMLSSVAVTAFAAQSSILNEDHTALDDTSPYKLENLEFAMEFSQAEEGITYEMATYYFYMPEVWKNTYNDRYINDMSECVPGIYWWTGSAIPGEYFPYSGDDWPGYAVTKEVYEDVFRADIPVDVPTIVWNNTVDGGMDPTQVDIYNAAYQTGNLNTGGYVGSDEYGFYPNGITTGDGSFKDMIFVVDKDTKSVNEHSGKITYGGAWFYYYGNGEYGTYPTKEEAGDFVYSKGDFPSTKLVVKPDAVEVGIDGTEVVTSNKTNVVYEVANPAIASITPAKEAGQFVVKGLAQGTTTIKFTTVDEAGNPVIDEETQAPESDTLQVKVTKPFIDPTSLTMKPGDMEFIIPFGFGEGAKWASSNTSVATVDQYGTVTAKSAGTATITVTQGSQKATCKVTVLANVKLSKTKATLKAGASTTLKVTGTTSKVTWTTSNKKVATVKNGKVTALKKGTATITAKVGGKSYQCKVTVSTNPKLSKSTLSVKKNKKATISVTGAATKVTVSKCKIAKVTVKNSKITVKGTKKGTQKLTVKANGVSMKLTVKVK